MTLGSLAQALCLLTLCLLPAGPGAAEVHGLIVRGLAGEARLERDWRAQQEAWERRLGEGGAGEVRVIAADGPDDRGARERLLAALDRWAEELDADDEAFLVLLGHGATTGGRYRFDVRGPRVRGAELRERLDRLPGPVWVVAPGPGGAGLAGLLSGAGTTVVSATDHPQQINPPRFGGLLAELLDERPGSPLLGLVAEADARVAAFYKDRKLVRTETAGVWRGGERLTLEAPEPAGSPTGPGASVELPPGLVDPGPDADHLVRPHTPEEAAALAAAPPAPGGDAMATVLRRDVRLDLKPDGSGLWRESAALVVHDLRARALVDGIWRPKAGTAAGPTRLIELVVVRPDGFTLAWTHQSEPPDFLPGVVDGSLVRFDFEAIARRNQSLPQFVGEVPLALPLARVLEQRVEVSHEQASPIAARLYDAAGAELESSTGGGFGRHVVASRGLPPATGEADPRLALSGFEGWGGFAAYVRDLMRDTVGDAEAVEAAALAWTADAPTRVGKIRALYDRASDLRYVSVPLGVRGLRPEPVSEVLRDGFADCKGKANLLVEMLAVVGIEAEFVVIDRFSPADRPLDPGFPTWGFNHAVVVVPDPDGTGAGPPLWMDATDGTAPLGTLTPGNAGRKALVIADPPRVVEVRNDPAALEALGLGGVVGPSSLELDLRAEGTDLVGTAAWSLRGPASMPWRAALRGGDAAMLEAFAEATARAWPTAELEAVELRSGPRDPALRLEARVRFAGAVLGPGGGLLVATPPGPWFQSRPPEPGVAPDWVQASRLHAPGRVPAVEAADAAADAAAGAVTTEPGPEPASAVRRLRPLPPSKADPDAPDPAFVAAAVRPLVFRPADPDAP